MASPVCYCLVISEREVIRAIRGGARTLTQVGQACAAGTGCTGCHPAIEAMLAEERERQAERAAAANQTALFGDK